MWPKIVAAEGRPASERTELRLLYSRDTLYIGVICHDRDPARIVVNETRRDSALDDTDSFQVILDTYLDRQNGFVFGTNPAGLEYDGQVTNERNDVRLKAGRFVTNLARARLSYSFNPRLYVQALLQYNDRIHNWSANLRLGWLQAANTGVFVVYNDNRDTSGGSPRDRGVVVKVSRTFDLLD